MMMRWTSVEEIMKPSILLFCVVIAAFAAAAGEVEIPFAEDSEGLSAGLLAGQGTDWAINGGDPSVVTNQGLNNSQGLDVNGDDISVSFTNAGDEVVWTDFCLVPKAMPLGAAPEPSTNSAAAFFFNTEGDLEVLNGSVWQVLDVNVDLTQLQQVVLCNNYTTQKSALWLNGIKTAETLSFANPVTYYGRFVSSRGAVLIDEVNIHRQTLAAGYGAWQMGRNWPVPGVDDQMMVDYDGDKAVNLIEYAFGTDPMDALSWINPACAVEGGEFAFLFQMNPHATDLTFQLRGTEDLMTGWTEIAPDRTTSVPSGDGYTQIVTYYTLMSPDNYFLRLQIQP